MGRRLWKAIGAAASINTRCNCDSGDFGEEPRQIINPLGIEAIAEPQRWNTGFAFALRATVDKSPAMGRRSRGAFRPRFCRFVVPP